MNPKQKVVSLITKTKAGKKLVGSQRYRIILSASVSFVFNLRLLQKEMKALEDEE